MLAVSDTAKRHLHFFLTSPDKPDSKGKCFRIVPTSHDLFLTLKLASPKPDDTTYTFDGKTVLALPKRLQKVCQDRRLHVDETGKLFLS
jgi:hypothetical protein